MTAADALSVLGGKNCVLLGDDENEGISCCIVIRTVDKSCVLNQEVPV